MRLLRSRVRIVENFLSDHPDAWILRVVWWIVGIPAYAVLLGDELVYPENAP